MVFESKCILNGGLSDRATARGWDLQYPEAGHSSACHQHCGLGEGPGLSEPWFPPVERRHWTVISRGLSGFDVSRVEPWIWAGMVIPLWHYRQMRATLWSALVGHTWRMRDWFAISDSLAELGTFI